MLRLQDRAILGEIARKVYAAKIAPARLFLPIEPTWAVCFAQKGAIVATEIFRPGDSEDAVRRAWNKFGGRAQADEFSLYLTIEPSAIYQRLPPVTESIRSTGIRRIIVGTLDPFTRANGHGVNALRNYGLEVILADGEEARNCQILYEDYAKVVNRFVPQLRLLCSLSGEHNAYRVLPFTGDLPYKSDAVVMDLPVFYKSDLVMQKQERWLVLLDAYAGLSKDRVHGKAGVDHLIIFVANTPEVEPKIPELRKHCQEVVPVPLKDGKVDLAITLRKLRDMGISSCVSTDGPDLWRTAIQSGLVDSIQCFIPDAQDSTRILASLASAPITFSVGEQQLSLRLQQPRCLDKTMAGLWVEAGLVCG